MEDLRIIFYGTAEFAVPGLESLSKNGFQPIAVVTAPDKPSGRGQKINESPVKTSAKELGIPVLQPRNMKSEDFIESIKELNPNLQVVIAFRMMPEVVWAYPKYGTLNLHASLLPNYRGAAPIHWAIINGEKETGVSTFFLKHEIDTGDIIMQEKEEILHEDTLGTLYEKLKVRGAKMLLKTVNRIQEGKFDSTPQQFDSHHKVAPKIFKDDAKVDWNEPAQRVYDLVRGTNPFPGAWTELNGKRINLHKVSMVEKESTGAGVIETDNRTFVTVGCRDKRIALELIQSVGGKKMNIRDYLNGNTL